MDRRGIGGEGVYGAGEHPGALYGVLADANLCGDALCRSVPFPILGSSARCVLVDRALLLLRLVPRTQQVSLLLRRDVAKSHLTIMSLSFQAE